MKKMISLSATLVLFLASMAAGTELASADVQRNFNVSSGGRLVVSVGGGDISVRIWDKMQVQMIARNIGEEPERLEASQDGNTVAIRYRPPSGWFGSSRNISFDFYVPKSFNVNLNTSGGDVRISGPLEGDASMHTSGGDLTLDGVAGEVDGTTSGGDIIARDIGGAANLVTSGGDIQVGQTAKDLVVATSGGDLSVGSVGGNLRASTSGGDVSIREVKGDLTASTSSGDVSVGEIGGSVKLSTAGGDISLKSGNGRVSANTSGGDINVLRATGSANVFSSGGTVKVGLVPEGDQSSRIESSGGDVYLYLPPDAKVTIKADISGGNDDRIVTDFPVTYESSSSRRAVFTMNGGGQDIYLHTSSGNIYVKKLTSSGN